MRVEFIEDWRGSKTGDIEDLNGEFCTGDLIPRKIVKPVQSSGQEKIEKQAAEIAKLKKQLKAKQIETAPRNKQMGAANNK